MIISASELENPLIMRTEYPYLICRPLFYSEFGTRHEGIKVADFRCLLIPDGCFVGGCDKEDLDRYLPEMAEKYRDEVIVPRYQRYKQYCEDRELVSRERRDKREERQEEEKKRRFEKISASLFKD